MSSIVLIGPPHSVAGFDCDRRWRKAGARDCYVMCCRRRGRRGCGRASAATRFRLNTDIRSKVVTAAVVPPLVFMEFAVVVISARLVKDPTPYFSRIERVRFEVAVFRAHRMHALGIGVDPFNEIALFDLKLSGIECG